MHHDSRIFYTSPEQNFLLCFAHFLTEKIKNVPGKNNERMVILLPSNRACLQLSECLRPSWPKNKVMPQLLALNQVEEVLSFFGYGEAPSTRPMTPAHKHGLFRLLMSTWKPHLPHSHVGAYSKSLGEILSELARHNIALPQLKNASTHTLKETTQDEYLSFLLFVMEHYPLLLKEQGLHDPLEKHAEQIRLLQHVLAFEDDDRRTGISIGIAGFNVSDNLPFMEAALKRHNGFVAIPFVRKDIYTEEYARNSDTEKSTHVDREFSPYTATKNLITHLENILSTEACALPNPPQTPHITSPKVYQAASPLAQAHFVAEYLLSLKSVMKNDFEETSSLLPLRKQKIAIVLPTRQPYLEQALRHYGLRINSSLTVGFSKTLLGSFLALMLDLIKNPVVPAYLALLKHSLLWKTLGKEEQKDVSDFVQKFTTTPQASLELHHHKLPYPLPESLFQKNCAEAVYGFVHTLLNFDVSASLDEILNVWHDDVRHIKEYFSTISKRAQLSDHEIMEHALEHGAEDTIEKPDDVDVHLIGLMEARLGVYDHLIFVDMNKGIFPRRLTLNPWLSSSLRKDFGLVDERDYAVLQEQDFLLALTAAPSITLCFTETQNGESALPSPFLRHFSESEDVRFSSSPLFSVSKNTPLLPLSVEKNRVAHGMKPKKISVSAITQLLRNPYAFYARYILHLKPREHVGTLSHALALGQAMHAALDTYVKKSGGFIKSDALALEHYFFNEARKAHISLSPFLCMRLKGTAKALCAYCTPLMLKSEVKGEKIMGEITLFARADALVYDTHSHHAPDNVNQGVHIWDYKTGTLPSVKDIHSGYAPQLPLEGLIFEALHPHTLTFVKLNAKPPHVEIRSLKNTAQLIDDANIGVSALLQQYLSDDFCFHPSPDDSGLHRPHHHLERVSTTTY